MSHHSHEGIKMSLVTEIMKSTIKVTGNEYTVTNDLVSEGLFVEVTGNFQLRARVDIANRAIIIGDYLPSDPPLLSSRKIDVFKDVNDMLSKARQYVSGAVAGKTVEDAVEVLSQYICLSENNCTNAAIDLSELFVQDKIAADLFEKSLFAIDYALRKDSTNFVLKKHVEKVWMSFYEQVKQGDARAAELMQITQKIGQRNSIDTPFWNQSYSDFMVNVIEKVTLQEGLNLDVALRVTKADYKRSPQDPQKKLAVVSLYIAHAIKFYNAQQFEKAIVSAEKALKIDPQKPEAKIWLAKCFNELSAQYLMDRREDKYQDVIAAQERAIELNPDFGRAYHNLAVALWLAHPDLSEIERVISLLEKNLSINLDDPLTKTELARAYDSLSGLYITGQRPGKSYLDAKALMEKAIVLAPDDPNIVNGLVGVLTMLAIQHIQGQITANSLIEGEAYLTQALQFLEKDLSVQTKGSIAIACNLFAVTFTNSSIANKSRTDSIALLERALELNPFFEQAKENLFYIYGLYIQDCISEFNKGLNIGFYAIQVKQTLEKALVLRPEDADCQALLEVFKKQRHDSN